MTKLINGVSYKDILLKGLNIKIKNNDDSIDIINNDNNITLEMKNDNKLS